MAVSCPIDSEWCPCNVCGPKNHGCGVQCEPLGRLSLFVLAQRLDSSEQLKLINDLKHELSRITSLSTRLCIECQDVAEQKTSHMNSDMTMCAKCVDYHSSAPCSDNDNDDPCDHDIFECRRIAIERATQALLVGDVQNLSLQ